MSKDIRSIAAMGVPIQRIVYSLRLIAIISSIIYYRFPKFLARNNSRFKANIKVLDIVVKKRLDIYAPFSK